MRRDFRVSEHLNTKSAVDCASVSGHVIEMLEKWRPPGRSNNRRTSGRTPPSIRSRSSPVSFGEVKGMVHSPFGSSLAREISDRSSREGKEQIRLKTSEGGAE